MSLSEVILSFRIALPRHTRSSTTLLVELHEERQFQIRIKARMTGNPLKLMELEYEFMKTMNRQL